MEHKPEFRHLNDPYVLQLIEALGKATDRIEELEDDLAFVDKERIANLNNWNLTEDIRRSLEKRVDELESGSCRFNCRSMKEAFMAGYRLGLNDGMVFGENHEDECYRFWLKEQREKTD